MIRMFQASNIERTKEYFDKALSKADYYLNDQEASGVFHGRVAWRLGIEGKPIDKETFDLLCDNINPQTGKNLTPRTQKGRCVGYDITFHCPKSVSVLYGITREQKILDAFKESVRETMIEIESAMQTRIRLNGQSENRDTGEMLWCDFTHLTARPVENHLPDPLLHQHIFCLNITHDPVEHRFKAGKFRAIKREMPYYQARFLKRLSDKLISVGYDGIRKTGSSFEMAMIPQKVIDLFSKRTELISRIAKQKNITNPKMLDKLGAITRKGKNNSKSFYQLSLDWIEQIENQGLASENKETPTTKEDLTVEEVVNFTIEKAFSRHSVKREKQLLALAYHHAVDNSNISVEQIDNALLRHKDIFKISTKEDVLYTTHKIKLEEKRMLKMANIGKGAFKSYKQDFEIADFDNLSEEQQQALEHVLRSKDFITMVRGGAGTGKTTLLKSLVPSIGALDEDIFLFAPTATASRNVLRSEGFYKADTVHKLLNDTALHEKLKNKTILIDEAGMLGVTQTLQIFSLAQKLGARLIFLGDPRQHSAVDRGDAMRLLSTLGQVPYFSLDTIYRQKHKAYKQAVKHISESEYVKGFEMLDKSGFIHEADYEQISEVLANEYIDCKRQKQSSLVITPTRANANNLNAFIREKLKENDFVAKKDKHFTSYKNLFLTDADKRDVRSYSSGQVIQVHQNLKTIKRGGILRVLTVDYNGGIIVEDETGNNYILPTNMPECFDVYNSHSMAVSIHDEIRITKNSFDLKNNRLDNGLLLKVTGFTKTGDIQAVKLDSKSKVPIILSKRHGNFDYAYCTTSHSSQGRTVDHVIISQPSITFGASNQKQFYVSVSRGRNGVSIYTDDSQELLENIATSADRLSVLELLETNKQDLMKL